MAAMGAYAAVMADVRRPATTRLSPQVVTTTEFQGWAAGLDPERRAKVIGAIARVAAARANSRTRKGRPSADLVADAIVCDSRLLYREAVRFGSAGQYSSGVVGGL